MENLDLPLFATRAEAQAAIAKNAAAEQSAAESTIAIDTLTVGDTITGKIIYYTREDGSVGYFFARGTGKNNGKETISGYSLAQANAKGRKAKFYTRYADKDGKVVTEPAGAGIFGNLSIPGKLGTVKKDFRRGDSAGVWASLDKRTPVTLTILAMEGEEPSVSGVVDANGTLLQGTAARNLREKLATHYEINSAGEIVLKPGKDGKENGCYATGFKKTYTEVILDLTKFAADNGCTWLA